jgi:hypothetical protein
VLTKLSFEGRISGFRRLPLSPKMDFRNDHSGRKPPVVPRGDKAYRDSASGSPGRKYIDGRVQRTVGSGSSSGTSNRSTPSSVLVGSVPLSRDLSDLTGSYHHGVTDKASQAKAIPRLIYNDDCSSVSSLQKSWRQAYVLSNPSPDTILSDLANVTDAKQPRIFLEENDSVELVRQCTNKPTLYKFSDSPRIPLLVLLMDTARKSYEILRIFVDSETDNVRDVLQSVRQNLPDQWKQDYDGLLQIRSGVASQLIHCLSVQHYDVQPFECWIAKPWSASAKNAGQLGETLIYHLKHLGVLVDTKGVADDVIVQLSEAAASRIYEPGGTLDHYHAKYYLSFSPPFEIAVSKQRVAADDKSHRSNQTSRSRGSSLEATLEALHEDADEQNLDDESHEVQTVSSYSHLSAVDPFKSIIEEKDDEVRAAPEDSFTMRRFDLEEEESDQDEKAPSPKIKGFVGKLLFRHVATSNRSHSSDESLLVHTGVQAPTWDLTPMNSTSTVASFGSREDLSHYSHQPLLKCTSGVDKPGRFRRN